MLLYERLCTFFIKANLILSIIVSVSPKKLDHDIYKSTKQLSFYYRRPRINYLSSTDWDSNFKGLHPQVEKEYINDSELLELSESELLSAKDQLQYNEAGLEQSRTDSEQSYLVPKLSVSSPNSPYALIDKYFPEREFNHQRKNGTTKSVDTIISQDLSSNLGRSSTNDVWLDDGNLLVLKGGVTSENFNGFHKPWKPLDDYQAPYRKPILPPAGFVVNQVTGSGLHSQTLFDEKRPKTQGIFSNDINVEIPPPPYPKKKRGSKNKTNSHRRTNIETTNFESNKIFIRNDQSDRSHAAVVRISTTQKPQPIRHMLDSFRKQKKQKFRRRRRRRKRRKGKHNASKSWLRFLTQLSQLRKADQSSKKRTDNKDLVETKPVRESKSYFDDGRISRRTDQYVSFYWGDDNGKFRGGYSYQL